MLCTIISSTSRKYLCRLWWIICAWSSFSTQLRRSNQTICYFRMNTILKLVSHGKFQKKRSGWYTYLRNVTGWESFSRRQLIIQETTWPNVLGIPWLPCMQLIRYVHNCCSQYIIKRIPPFFMLFWVPGCQVRFPVYCQSSFALLHFFPFIIIRPSWTLTVKYCRLCPALCIFSSKRVLGPKL